MQAITRAQLGLAEAQAKLVAENETKAQLEQDLVQAKQDLEDARAVEPAAKQPAAVAATPTENPLEAMGQIVPSIMAKFGPAPPEGLATLLATLQQTLLGIEALPVPEVPKEPAEVPVPQDAEGDSAMQDANRKRKDPEGDEQAQEGKGGAALVAARNSMLGGFDIQASQLQPILDKLKQAKPSAKAKPAASSSNDGNGNGRSRSPKANP